MATLAIDLLAILILISLYCLFRGVEYAKEITPLTRSSKVLSHKRWIDRFLLSLFPPVLLIELFVRYQNGRWGNEALFLVHMIFVATFVSLICAMRFVWTGQKNPSMHRRLSRFFFIAFIGVACTGVWLIIQLNPQA